MMEATPISIALAHTLNNVRRLDPSHPATVTESPSAADIGTDARHLDAQPWRQRLRLSRSTLYKLPLIAVAYAAAIALASWLVTGSGDSTNLVHASLAFAPVVFLLAFLFETLDSAAGMGFGTALAPLLFWLGYAPLEVVPVLLLTEAITGFVSAGIHHEFQNVQFRLRGNLNAATRLMCVIAGTGMIAIVASISLTYLAIQLPSSWIKGYVAFLVLLMGVAALIRRYRNRASTYRPRRMILFAAWAGFNKGIGGGGYGPVVTLGQVYSGVYEKSAAAITSLAEGLVSLAGVAAFFALEAAGVDLNLRLLPSILAGSLLAAIIAPYLVRVLPNRVIGYIIPGYASALAVILVLQVVMN